MNVTIEKYLSNYINGNLQDAKRLAERYNESEIRGHLEAHLGYSANKAALVAAWLKGADCWQAACDAE